ncbi:MAG: hypothetical protein K2W82_00070 [Candidatus Obscuribacterales bacterium]|nr:hypothetical protein [Candidatus Obscuribacterales bacterium]
MILLGLGTLLGIIQNISGIASLPTIAYGWRMYFLCVPLCFLIAEHYGRKDLLRLIRHSLLISTFMSVLVFIQYKSPTKAWINKLLDEESTAYSYGGLARASGTFAFTQGHEQFCYTLAAIVMACWLLPKANRPQGKIMMVLSTIAVMINVLLDGNRGVFFSAAIIYLFSILHRVLTFHMQRFTVRRIAPEIGLLIAALIYGTVLSPAMEGMRSRVESNQHQEGLLDRVVDTIITFDLETLEHLTVIGYGFGSGLPAGKILRGNFPVPSKKIGQEFETSRILDETGIFGVVWILSRMFFAGYLVYSSIQCSRREGFPLPLMLAGYSAFTIWHGQITTNGTTEYYGWLFAGLTLAAARPRLQSAKRPNLIL